MTCDHARCDETATTALRFGDGYVRMPGIPAKRQSYAVYCDPHADTVGRMFATCDVGPARRANGGSERVNGKLDRARSL